MKNKMIKLAVVAAASVALAQTVQATPIDGSIGFTGSYTQNGGNQGDLTTATSFATTILTATATFGTVTSSTFFTPIDVNDTPDNNLLGQQLWTAVIGGVTYSLVVNSESQTFTSTSQLDLAGTGTFGDETLGDATAGTWQLQFGVTGNSFTWNSTSGTNVPDGGTTAMLLGAGLSGLALLKRKLVA